MAPYRLKILTALSAFYTINTIQLALTSPHLFKDLVDCFTLALFGRHATVHEVTTWRGRCEVWLADTRDRAEPVPEPEPGHEHEHEPQVKPEPELGSEEQPLSPSSGVPEKEQEQEQQAESTSIISGPASP